ncbi:MAG: bifunctional (p)ppGpp synthetase/guanosine-3',5'-bis(diphosphate) 3'-pyrophosphohydrolase [Hyphomonadaceae bacterium]|nr:bifunctional (p)ppGpp synthetase/guanosine-3',5'-bis(diphosphate) 3'-pyrophosphohydrolase [Clostridia bacterium]
MSASFESLLNKLHKFCTPEQVAMVEKAYNYSKSAHDGQMRKTGEPYMIHPLAVAHILADLEMDYESIIAGLLHDVLEDTTKNSDEIKQLFGETVLLLVDGVTKLGQIPYTTKEEQQIENLRKMFFAMAKDIRVIFIKLADRMHNLRTLGSMTEDKQREKATETLQVYAPLAHRLGIFQMKWELEDLSLRYLDPPAYYEIVESIAQKRKERENYIKDIMENLELRLKEMGVPAKIDGRAKHFYSIYRKMYAQGKGIDEIYDLFATRVIVDNVQDCYAVLGLVHEMYHPLPGRFKDYIAMPKPNLYQSLHTTVIGPAGKPFEIQIRTWEMHKICEYGIAAHWKYKEGKSGEDSDLDSKLTWLRQLLEIQRDLNETDDFMQSLKINMFADEVFAFTPKGHVVNLPAGANPIDFAYAIHSAVGNKMMGAKISGRIVPLDYTLKNGDIVEILTSSSVHGPSLDWLKICKTSQARNKINQWFKKEKREENVIRGKHMLELDVKKHGYTLAQLIKPEFLQPIYKKYTLNNIEDLHAAIGHGGVLASKVVARLKEQFLKTIKPDERELFAHVVEPHRVVKKKSSNQGIVVKGIDNCLVRLSRCCNPVPGDDISGYITRGRGVSVHRADCLNVTREETNDEQRLIEVEWESTVGSAYLVDIQVKAYDRTGLLLEVSNQIAEDKIAIKSMQARILKDNTALMQFTLEVSSSEQLNKIIKKLFKINGVIDVGRAKQ